MKINVTIRESLTRKVEVEAETKEEALQKICQAYKDGEIVLDWDDFAEFQLSVDEND